MTVCIDDKAKTGLKITLACLPFNFRVEFDEGHLSNDPIAAQEEIDKTMALMGEIEPPLQREADPILWLFQNIWIRIKKVCMPPHFLRDPCVQYHELT